MFDYIHHVVEFISISKNFHNDGPRANELCVS